jgi:histone acetyltransferase (RNA polymerase elongator complex component)
VPHEGCPHNCVFCNQNSITGHTTKIDAAFVKQTIEEYLETIPTENRVLEVSFFGGTFTAININKQKELLKVAKDYKEKRLVDLIRLSTRPDYIDDLILSNLKEYTVDIIELGVQSLDEEVLRQSARGHSEEDVVRASKLIKDYGFILGHQIMLGLPGDNFNKDILTTEKIISLKPDICRIYPSLVIKDTPMETMYNINIYKPYTLEEAVKISKVVYGMLVSNNINVIRVGLQATEEINEGKDIIAGPFHPSFRELVEGSILNDMVREALHNIDGPKVELAVNIKDLSKLYCDKKRFFNDTIRQYASINVKVVQLESINRGEIILKYNDNCKMWSINDYLAENYKEGYSKNL